MGPRHLFAVRQRTGPALLRPADQGAVGRSRLRGGPGLRPGQPDRAARRALARGPCARCGQLSGDDRGRAGRAGRPGRVRSGPRRRLRCGPRGRLRCGPRGRVRCGPRGRQRGAARVRPGRHPELAPGPPGRRVLLQRRAAMGAWPPQPADQLGTGAGPGRLAGLPAAGQLRPAQPYHPARPGRVSPVAGPAGRRPAEPPGHGSRGLSGRAGCGRVRGGRVGNHLPARAARRERGTRLVPGQWAAPGAGRAHPAGRGRLRRRVRRPAPRGLPAGPYGTVLPFRRIFVVAQR